MLFEQLADGTIFRGPDGKPHMKIGGDSVIAVRLTASGWMSYGTSFKWKPEWGLTFEHLLSQEADDMIRENMTSGLPVHFPEAGAACAVVSSTWNWNLVFLCSLIFLRLGAGFFIG